MAAGAPIQPQYEKMEAPAEEALFAGEGMKVVTAFNGTRTDPPVRGEYQRTE